MLSIGLTFLLITIVGLIGNCLVLFVIALNKQLHESTSIFICNLALADLLFLIFCVPLTAYSYVYSWEFSSAICYVTVNIQYVTCYVSVWTLVLLAYDRFVSITNPNTSPKSLRRSRTVIYVCLGVWLTGFALNFVQLRNVGVLVFEYNGTLGMACVDSLSIATGAASKLDARLFYWGFNLGAYFMPLTLSILFYFLLVRVIWRQKLVQSKSSHKVKRHATKMVFIVIVTFGACWFPQHLRFFLRGLNYPAMSFWETDEKVLLWVQCSVQILAYANSCMNPILYGILSERFRLGFHRVYQRFMLGIDSQLLSRATSGHTTLMMRTTPLPSKRPSYATATLAVAQRDLRRMTEPIPTQRFHRVSEGRLTVNGCEFATVSEATANGQVSISSDRSSSICANHNQQQQKATVFRQPPSPTFSSKNSTVNDSEQDKIEDLKDGKYQDISIEVPTVATSLAQTMPGNVKSAAVEVEVKDGEEEEYSDSDMILL